MPGRQGLGLAAMRLGSGGVAGPLQEIGQAQVGVDRVGVAGEDEAQLLDREPGLAQIVEGHGQEQARALVRRVELEGGAEGLQGGGRLAPRAQGVAERGMGLGTARGEPHRGAIVGESARPVAAGAQLLGDVGVREVALLDGQGMAEEGEGIRPGADLAAGGGGQR
ncbi:MAG TPA: hypothetical protein VHG32_06320, partial [Thermoanaerobaculia bacterium]|nr:hypothetical protein [Thermoanaerobaculia bacterium]